MVCETLLIFQLICGGVPYVTGETIPENIIEPLRCILEPEDIISADVVNKSCVDNAKILEDLSRKSKMVEYPERIKILEEKAELLDKYESCIKEMDECKDDYSKLKEAKKVFYKTIHKLNKLDFEIVGWKR